MRESGIVVRREPGTRRELARIVSRANPRVASRAPAPRLEPRRFGDAALIEIAEGPSSIACECLRDMTEIVAQLASFEQYSRDCRSSSPADAALHAKLSLTAGVARTSVEHALQRMLAMTERRIRRYRRIGRPLEGREARSAQLVTSRHRRHELGHGQCDRPALEDAARLATPSV